MLCGWLCALRGQVGEEIVELFIPRHLCRKLSLFCLILVPHCLLVALHRFGGTKAMI